MLIFWFLGVGLDRPWNIFALETVEGALWKGRCVLWRGRCGHVVCELLDTEKEQKTVT